MKDYEVVILGGGPAGLTAGLYAARYGINTLLIERGMFGGKIVNARLVDNYPGFPAGISGMDLGQQMYDQAVKFGLIIATSEITGFRRKESSFEITTDDEEYSAKSVIIALGSDNRKMGVDGEDRLSGRGISYCATCDGFLFKDKIVAVVGGGDTALSDALELSEHCKGVFIIHRRDQLRGSEVLQREVLSNPRIKMIWNSEVLSIEGEQKLRLANLRNIKTGAVSQLEVDGIFVAIGLIPNSDLFKGIVELDEAGTIASNELMCTSVPGIYVAGDIRKNSPRQVVTAAGDGATAAKSAFHHIRGRA
jgi:thioredoxin reductase (NADPH)